MTHTQIIQDLLRKNPQFFQEYESLAQRFYNSLDSVTAIPEAHAKALLTLLEESGYEVRKRVPLKSVENSVVLEINNVLSFKK